MAPARPRTVRAVRGCDQATLPDHAPQTARAYAKTTMGGCVAPHVSLPNSTRGLAWATWTSAVAVGMTDDSDRAGVSPLPSKRGAAFRHLRLRPVISGGFLHGPLRRGGLLQGTPPALKAQWSTRPLVRGNVPSAAPRQAAGPQAIPSSTPHLSSTMPPSVGVQHRHGDRMPRLRLATRQALPGTLDPCGIHRRLGRHIAMASALEFACPR